MDNQSSSLDQSPAEPPTPQNVPPQPVKPQPYWAKWVIILLTVALVCFAISSYLYLSQQNTKSKPSPTTTNSNASKPNQQATWKTYTNTQVHYSFQYLSSWILNNAVNDPTAFVLHHQNVKITGGYISKASLNTMGVTVCGDRNTTPRCETFKINDTLTAEIDWGTKYDSPTQAFVTISDPIGGMVTMQLTPVNSETRTALLQILSTFKFLGQSISPTCRPRPACLDATPHCMIAQTDDMCPPTKPTKPVTPICTDEAKQCPDGSYVGRTGPNCEFAACPKPL